MMRILPRLLWAGLLLTLAGPVLALGLGRIEVRSQQGQPLLAEIPVVSSDPAELRQLQARLASPDTFARIGLEPPQGLVSDLQFSVALDPRGRPVIRVTSAAPVQQDTLTFLVEVDWGQGRLVREYSALVAVPDTLAAPAQPSIQAPVGAPPARIVRAPDAPAAAPATSPSPVADGRDPAPAPDAVTPSAPATPAARPIATPLAVTGDLAPVAAGQTLSELAAPLASEAGISVNQAMVLLLRANPEAFIGGNLNLVRQGAVLRVPPRDEWTALSAAEANAVVREQVGRWREMRQPAPQPDAQGEVAAAAAPAVPATGAPGAQARLEITPPSGDVPQAGTQSGIDAGGGGDMLRQELQQANESLAARNAEVDELKARLADLEQLQQKQQQLIELKDDQLAAAQQRMEANAPSPSTVAGDVPWGWLLVGLLVVGALAFVLGRRARGPVATRRFDGAALAAGRPAAPASVEPAADPVAPPPAPVVAAPAAAAAGARPTWHAGTGAAAAAAAPAPADPLPPSPAPAMTAPVADGGDETDEETARVVPTPPARADADMADDAPELPAGVERLELARAYLDLGDTDTARSLLREVAAGDDAAAATEAAALLRTLD